MSDLELFSTLAAWAAGAFLFGATVGWYGFLYAFKMLDDYLQS